MAIPLNVAVPIRLTNSLGGCQGRFRIIHRQGASKFTWSHGRRTGLYTANSSETLLCNPDRPKRCTRRGPSTSFQVHHFGMARHGVMIPYRALCTIPDTRTGFRNTDCSGLGLLIPNFASIRELVTGWNSTVVTFIEGQMYLNNYVFIRHLLYVAMDSDPHWLFKCCSVSGT